MDKPSEFVKAKIAARLEIKHAIIDKDNPHFKSRYASLASVLDAVVLIYAKHGINIEQRRVQKEDGNWVLQTWREHVSGERDLVPDEQSLDGGTVQQRGSSLTYGRRYGLSCLAGIASEEDDDGEAASNAPAIKGKSALKQHEEGHYGVLQKGIRAQVSLEGLKQYWEDNKMKIRELSPGWLEYLHEEKDRKKQELIEEADEDTELKKQLKGSLV